MIQGDVDVLPSLFPTQGVIRSLWARLFLELLVYGPCSRIARDLSPNTCPEPREKKKHTLQFPPLYYRECKPSLPFSCLQVPGLCSVTADRLKMVMEVKEGEFVSDSFWNLFGPGFFMFSFP